MPIVLGSDHQGRTQGPQQGASSGQAKFSKWESVVGLGYFSLYFGVHQVLHA